MVFDGNLGVLTVAQQQRVNEGVPVGCFIVVSFMRYISFDIPLLVLIFLFPHPPFDSSFSFFLGSVFFFKIVATLRARAKGNFLGRKGGGGGGQVSVWMAASCSFSEECAGQGARKNRPLGKIT